MIRTFAKTLTDGELSEQGMELRIQHPRSPHTKPHPGGGHIVLMRYVTDQAYLPVAVHGHHNQGCNTGCNTMQEHQFLGGGRLEAEIMHYTGYRCDNDLVLVLDKRGLEGTVAKHWDCGTLVMQTATGSDFQELYDLIATINNNITLSPANNPSAWARVGTATNQKQSGDKPPSSANKTLLTGGFKFDASGNLVVPKTGIYDGVFRVATIATEQKLYQNPYKLKVQLLVNGQVETQLIQDDYAGKTPGEELNDYRLPLLSLNAGDLVMVHTTDESSQNWLSAYDVKLVFVSNQE